MGNGCAPLTAGCQRISLLSPSTRGHMHPTKRLFPVSLIALAAVASGCVQRADVATEERVIRDLDKKWVQAVAAKDTAAIANVYAVDAEFLAPGAPRAGGRAAVRQAWVGLLKAANLVLTFDPTKITIASSADIAYETGSDRPRLELPQAQRRKGEKGQNPARQGTGQERG